MKKIRKTVFASLLMIAIHWVPFLQAVEDEKTAPTTQYSSPQERGAAELPFNTQLRNSIDNTFYKNGKISAEKIKLLHDSIHKRYMELKTNLENVFLHIEGKSARKASKNTAKQAKIQAYELLLENIQKLQVLKNHQDKTPFHMMALQVLEIEAALKVSGKRLASTMLFQKVPESLKPRKINLRTAPEGEAANLVDPVTGRFYTQEQLVKLKAEDVDISRLNPPFNSTYWQPNDIPKVDVKTHYQSGQDPLHKGLNITFPDTKGYFKKVRKTQTKPKIDITYRDPETGEKLTFKLKIGAEMHSEPTAAALFATLGFSVDLCKYVRDFKVILGRMTPFEFKREWSSYYSRYDVNKYIKQEGKDEEGHFLIFHEGLLEAKPDRLIRIGPWAYGTCGRKGLREVRATLLFNMWVSNIDLKESENNKLILREIKGKPQFFHIQHDMGFAFGNTYVERPGEFKWKLVKRKTRDHIALSYRCFQENSGFKHITYADGRWFTRLLAQLSREQIQAAIKLGGWPPSMGQLLVEKLIARRNQFVEAFDLPGEKMPNGKTITLLPYNRHLTTPDGVVVNGKLKVYRIPGYKQFFGPRIAELIPLMLRKFRGLVVDGVVGGMSAIQYFKLDPQWVDGNPNIILHFLIRTNREIEPNPLPTGENDAFLVRDTLEIGSRVGYGNVISADNSFTRKYTVVYPVRTIEQGRYHNNFIINLAMPGQVKKFGMDKKFVAMVEDYYELRGRLKAAEDHHFIIGADATASKVLLHRYLISRKAPDQLIYFEDRGLLNELKYRFFFELQYIFNFRIPIFNRSIQKGKMNRRYVYLDLSDIHQDPGKHYALKKLLLEDDASYIKKIGKHKTIDSRFFQRKFKLNLLGFLNIRSVYRVDQLDEKKKSTTNNPATENIECYYQVESQLQKKWRFADNGESLYSHVRLTCRSDKTRTMRNPVLYISFRIEDKNTSSSELKNSYLPFINTIALDPRFIDFDPNAHTRNKKWGHLRVLLQMHLYQEALDRLINLESTQIWQALSEVTGKSVKQLKQSVRPTYVRGRPVYRYRSATGSSYFANKAAYLIRALKKARMASDNYKRVRLIVKAIRKAVYFEGHGFEPRILAMLHKLVGQDNLYIDASVTMPGNKEMVFPERKPLHNRRGKKQQLEPLIFNYIFDDPDEIYHLF